MLRELRIRNLAVIESVTVPFAAGLNVLTGETGAGKSIVVDAVLLVRGARATAEAIRTESDAALVEAVFEVGPADPAMQVLAEAGLAAEDGQVVIRRELTRAGRHRAFINDSPVTLALLESLGDHLVEVHGQHEHQRLLEPGRQLDLLDRFGGSEQLRARVTALHAKHRVACAALERTRLSERDRAQREDLLRFQVSELDAARLRPGEEEALRAERRRLQHAERFLAGLAESEGHLDEAPDSARARLGRAARTLHDLGRLDPSFAAPAAPLEAALAHVEETLRALRALRESVAVDPGRLEAVDERLDVLTRLRRKYGESEVAMLQFRDAAAAELEQLARTDALLADQARVQAELWTELAARAGDVSAQRRATAEQLARRTERELHALGMERAQFLVRVEPGGPEALAASGWDRVGFLLSANPGEEPRPLARVASGGELSRTMLALHAALAAPDVTPTMVFDEVDAGVGGRIAGVVGQRLADLAAGPQVLCVTHLAQIAALADHHLRVAKSVRGGRTRAAVAALEGEERVGEIARMLGGETRAAREHARALLNAPRRPRRV